ncbi:MAG: geranylgeranylglyceryl/heptaprenylglyceryl phosphate synthase [Candidatus Cloacimonetes bacterium]|nr:geranylgeranylglyceryl/heptaprenylglyceryl phosphate synthase [Candidatus Cloacimonadota bacterium]MBL7087121.1 geranylgeranylglyceryl/heptaprenylglyceryl phosphate synthase [Candidatus Cloacimonadota bacterium]
MNKDTVYDFLLKTIKTKGAGFLCLIDPDKQESEKAVKLARKCAKSDVDAIFVGGSIMLEDNFNSTIKAIKQFVKIPIIIFPGIFNVCASHADAILFMSMVSSRNPQLLIGDQVKAAPLIKKSGIETIPTGYMLIESGALTSVQYMSNSVPIPRDKYDIGIAHALAAQYLGMKLIFMDAGSGAKRSIPLEMIRQVKSNINIPLIIGGGIKTPEEAQEKVKAGADFIVIGNAIENNDDQNLIEALANAIHQTL